ncbi:MAG: type II toxin-antitoxin system prevent-host-death family antitoxin [Candidatus Omnitrophica bacterium]|nr:type II toxin-antitoxin system prevent-host-death family antitoxin [Candidatus Omnitrophota bacterium]
MTTSGILETRSHLSGIIKEVMRGEEHVIMKKNVPVAKIVPVTESFLCRSKSLIKEIKELRQSVDKITIEELNQWKRQGRA